MPKSKEFLDSSDDSDVEKTPKKKQKVEKKEKESKESTSAGVKGSNGETMFQLARMRFVTVSEFRGKKMISIREYYEADGEKRPGKKGISLSLEQWEALKGHIDDVDKEIRK